MEGENQRGKVTYLTYSIRKIGSYHLLPHWDSPYLKMTQLDDLKPNWLAATQDFI